MTIELDAEYEARRWLPDEAILYIGKTDRTIKTRLNEFYRHQCGRPSPHAGGQIVKLLQCNLFVYWSAAANPKESERKMLECFKSLVGQVPFANKDYGRKKRIRTLSLGVGLPK